MSDIKSEMDITDYFTSNLHRINSGHYTLFDIPPQQQERMVKILIKDLHDHTISLPARRSLVNYNIDQIKRGVLTITDVDPELQGIVLNVINFIVDKYTHDKQFTLDDSDAISKFVQERIAYHNDIRRYLPVG